MYITTGVNDTVIALDARTGTAKWKFQPKLGFTTFCCVPTTGVVVDDGRYSWPRSTDCCTRSTPAPRRRWQTTVGSRRLDSARPMAPHAWNRMVFIGSAGGEYGIRVSVTAYSQATASRYGAGGQPTRAKAFSENRDTPRPIPGIDRYHRSITRLRTPAVIASVSCASQPMVGDRCV